MTDPARLLARQSQHGYTTSPAHALTDAGEAPTADQQAQITRNAHDRVNQLTRAQLREARQQLQAEAEYHQAQLRNRQRRIRRIDQQLATAPGLA